jgi:SRSO17 transposase
LDASGHPKQGDKTPGVQHQYCGQRGKQENCVVGQHLLYSDGRGDFTCLLDSRLYLPRSWTEDRPRCQEAGIPDDLEFQVKWQIGLEQVGRAIGNGIRFSYILFDADYGKAPKFWFGLDEMGQRGIGHVAGDFNCWTSLPHWHSGRAEHASKTVEHLVRHSPVFTQQPWVEVTARELTRGLARWRMKSTRVHLVAEPSTGYHGPATPTDRKYWLIVAENLRTQERRYFISNAPADADPRELLRIGLERWQVEQWFERAKQECGLGAFEVRTYVSLMRHWLCSRLAMLFLAEQTQRLRGEKSRHHAGAGGHRDAGAELDHLARHPEQLACPHSELHVPPAA